jgi:hypothetical protein
MLKSTEVKKGASLYGGVDPLEAAIILNAKYTVLPELLEIFGADHLLHFLTVFGGRTVKVPPVEDIEKTLVHLTIWSTLKNAQNKDNAAKRLSLRYDMPRSDIRAAYKRVQEMIDGQTRWKEAAVEVGAQLGSVEVEERSSIDTGALFGVDSE